MSEIYKLQRNCITARDLHIKEQQARITELEQMVQRLEINNTRKKLRIRQLEKVIGGDV